MMAISVKKFILIIPMLKKLRRKSSYDFTVDFNKQEAFDCLIQADEFISKAKKFL